jgi:glycosyltransferase 2 family protein
VPQPSPKKTLSVLWTVCKYVVALGLLVATVLMNLPGLTKIWTEHVLTGKIHWDSLALAGVICLLSTLLTFVRWYFLVRAVKLPFTVADALRLGLVGFYFNIFMPGAVGGDILKAAYLAREQDRRTAAVATVIMDRVIGLWGMFWFVTLLGGAFWLAGWVPEEAKLGCGWIVVASAATVVASVVAWALLGLCSDAGAEGIAQRLGRLPKVGGTAAELCRAVWMYRRQPAVVYGTLLLSVLGFVGFVLTYYYSVLTLQEPSEVPSLAVHFLIVPIGLLVAAVAPVPNGIGIGELGFSGLYFLVKADPSIAVSGSLLQRVITWGLGVVGLVVYQRMRPALRRQPQEVPAQAAAPLLVPAEAS